MGITSRSYMCLEANMQDIFELRNWKTGVEDKGGRWPKWTGPHCLTKVAVHVATYILSLNFYDLFLHKYHRKMEKYANRLSSVWSWPVHSKYLHGGSAWELLKSQKCNVFIYHEFWRVDMAFETPNIWDVRSCLASWSISHSIIYKHIVI